LISSNGQIVFTGGVTITPAGGALMDMSTVYVFDTVKNTWQKPTAKSTGKVPSNRADHSAILTADGKIAVFGGDNNQPIWGRQFIAEVAVLDPSTWTWTTVTSYNGVEPSLRSFASAQLYQNKYMLVTFGTNAL
jgi:N-acetylneuraminic acid mutarotase